jgi:hypothetical protein
VNVELSQEARAYGDLARRALESADGDPPAQAVAADPGIRRAPPAVASLEALGAWDLDPRSGGDELEAAAALCRSVGYRAVTHPVAERLCRPPGMAVDALAVVADRAPGAPVGGFGLAWVTVTMDGRRHRVVGGSAGPAIPGAPVAPLHRELLDEQGAGDLALGLLLPCWTLLGLLDRALELSGDHVRQRQQFGQPLASFQGVQFQLTDAEVERAGAEELAKYALWSVASARPDAVADVLACRLAMVEAATVVFRVAHQLHGATGFCDETALSWVSRASLPLRRLPFGVSGTLQQLERAIGRRGLSGIFGGAVS